MDNEVIDLNKRDLINLKTSYKISKNLPLWHFSLSIYTQHKIRVN